MISNTVEIVHVTHMLELGDHVVVRDQFYTGRVSDAVEVWVLGEVVDIDDEGGFTYDVLDHSYLPEGYDLGDQGALFVGDVEDNQIVSAHSVS